jgi:hypothetical protein
MCTEARMHPAQTAWRAIIGIVFAGSLAFLAHRSRA